MDMYVYFQHLTPTRSIGHRVAFISGDDKWIDSASIWPLFISSEIDLTSRENHIPMSLLTCKFKKLATPLSVVLDCGSFLHTLGVITKAIPVSLFIHCLVARRKPPNVMNRPIDRLGLFIADMITSPLVVTTLVQLNDCLRHPWKALMASLNYPNRPLIFWHLRRLLKSFPEDS